MEKNAFLKLCASFFKANGFSRKGNSFYYDNKDGILLVFGLNKSSYGPYYYMEHGCVFTEINKHLPFPKYNELDINLGRIMLPYGKAIHYELMGENDCNDLVDVIQQQINLLRPAIDGGREQIVRQLFYSGSMKISYVLKGTPEYLGIGIEYFKENRIAIVDF